MNTSKKTNPHRAKDSSVCKRVTVCRRLSAKQETKASSAVQYLSVRSTTKSLSSATNQPPRQKETQQRSNQLHTATTQLPPTPSVCESTAVPSLENLSLGSSDGVRPRVLLACHVRELFLCCCIDTVSADRSLLVLAACFWSRRNYAGRAGEHQALHSALEAAIDHSADAWRDEWIVLMIFSRKNGEYEVLSTNRPRA